MFRTFLGVAIYVTFSVCALQAQHVYTFYSNSNSPLPDNTIRCLTPQGDTTLWIGTDWGLVKYTPSTWQVYQQSNSPISDNYIRSIAINENNHVWVGTANDGVNVISDTGWHNYNISNSPLPSNHVKAIAFDTSGHVWMGTIGGVATIQDTGWALFNMSNAPFDVNNTGAMHIGSDNTKWFGTVNGGLLRLQNGNWTKFRNNNSALPDNTILSMFPDDTGNIWMAMPAGGVAFYDGSFEIFNTLNSNISSNSFRSVVLDTLGKVYLASADKGFIRFTGGNNWTSFNSLENPDTNQTYLNTSDILSVTVDSHQDIWAGTNGNGLVRMETVTVDTIIDGIFDIEAAKVSFFPNPIQEELHVLTDGSFNQVTIVNSMGQQVYHIQINDAKIKLPFGQQPKGNYLIVLENKNSRIVFPVTKQ